MSETPAKQDPQQIVIDSTNKKFEALKQQSSELAKQCKNIKISDEGTLAMAQQVLSKTNQLLKSIDEKRLLIKKPYFEAGKTIDAIANSMLKELEDSIDYGKLQLKLWNEEQDRKKAEADAENEKMSKRLNDIRDQLTEKTAACKTDKQCDDLIASINEKFPKKEFFGPYAEDAMVCKDNFIKMLGVRKEVISAAVEGNADEAAKALKGLDKLQEMHNEVKQEAEEKKHAIAEANTTQKSATRKTWEYDFNPDSLAGIPLQYLMVNDKAVKEHMKNNKQEDGSIKPIPGIRFFQKETPILK